MKAPDLHSSRSNETSDSITNGTESRDSTTNHENLKTTLEVAPPPSNVLLDKMPASVFDKQHADSLRQQPSKSSGSSKGSGSSENRNSQSWNDILPPSPRLKPGELLSNPMPESPAQTKAQMTKAQAESLPPRPALQPAPEPMMQMMQMMQQMMQEQTRIREQLQEQNATQQEQTRMQRQLQLQLQVQRKLVDTLLNERTGPHPVPQAAPPAILTTPMATKSADTAIPGPPADPELRPDPTPVVKNPSEMATPVAIPSPPVAEPESEPEPAPPEPRPEPEPGPKPEPESSSSSDSLPSDEHEYASDESEEVWYRDYNKHYACSEEQHAQGLAHLASYDSAIADLRAEGEHEHADMIAADIQMAFKAYTGYQPSWDFRMSKDTDSGSERYDDNESEPCDDPPPPAERRIDSSDGNPYTMHEFQNEYGGLEEWDESEYEPYADPPPPEPPPSDSDDYDEADTSSAASGCYRSSTSSSSSSSEDD